MKGGKRASKRTAESHQLLVLLAEHGDKINVHLANQLMRQLGAEPAQRVAAALEFLGSELTSEQIERALRTMEIRFGSRVGNRPKS